MHPFTKYFILFVIVLGVMTYVSGSIAFGACFAAVVVAISFALLRR